LRQESEVNLLAVSVAPERPAWRLVPELAGPTIARHWSRQLPDQARSIPPTMSAAVAAPVGWNPMCKRGSRSSRQFRHEPPMPAAPAQPRRQQIETSLSCRNAGAGSKTPVRACRRKRSANWDAHHAARHLDDAGREAQALLHHPTLLGRRPPPPSLRTR